MIQKVQCLVGSGTPLFGEFPDRKVENPSLYANIDKAKRILDWAPKISLEDGLKKTITFYRDVLRNNKEILL